MTLPGALCSSLPGISEAHGRIGAIWWERDGMDLLRAKPSDCDIYGPGFLLTLRGLVTSTDQFHGLGLGFVGFHTVPISRFFSTAKNAAWSIVPLVELQAPHSSWRLPR